MSSTPIELDDNRLGRLVTAVARLDMVLGRLDSDDRMPALPVAALAAPVSPSPLMLPVTSTLRTCVLSVFLIVSHSDSKKPLPDSNALIRASSQYLLDSSAAFLLASASSSVLFMPASLAVLMAVASRSLTM